MGLPLMADSMQAAATMREYVQPIMHLVTSVAALAAVFFLTYGGFIYMSSRGQPDKLDNAKSIIKNSLLGLVIILGAAALTSLLSGAMQTNLIPPSGNLPTLEEIKPNDSGNALVDMVIKTITGLLNTIIQTVATPFLDSLSYFTRSTPLMSENPSVFNLWLVSAAMASTLFVVVVALIGFHVMSASTFGLDRVELKHLLPRIGFVFLLLNSSLFVIDGFIRLSNVLILAITQAGNGITVWETLSKVVSASGGQGIAALLIMLAFLIFSVALLVYYVGRLVTLFIGAVLSPFIVLVWLVPGFRDFSETAIKTYLSTIFVLFVHVVILVLAASLFTGMSAVSGNDTPSTLIAMVAGLATITALLKTQGVMSGLSYASLGPRSMRQLGSQFMNGVSYMGAKESMTTGAGARSSTLAKTSSGGNNGKHSPLGSLAAARSNGGVGSGHGKSGTKSTSGTSVSKVTVRRQPAATSSAAITPVSINAPATPTVEELISKRPRSRL